MALVTSHYLVYSGMKADSLCRLSHAWYTSLLLHFPVFVWNNTCLSFPTLDCNIFQRSLTTFFSMFQQLLPMHYIPRNCRSMMFTHHTDQTPLHIGCIAAIFSPIIAKFIVWPLSVSHLYPWPSSFGNNNTGLLAQSSKLSKTMTSRLWCNLSWTIVVLCQVQETGLAIWGHYRHIPGATAVFLVTQMVGVKSAGGDFATLTW